MTTARPSCSFADTMKMSTYLVAFVVGPLEATEPVDVGGTPLRVVVPAGQATTSPAFALEVGAFSLDFFADYYGIPYPGDKLDLVAIPDFAFGAMENLGCVTFREIAAAGRPRHRHPGRAASASPTSSPTRSPTCGSATS